MADAKRMKFGGRSGKEQKNENIQVFVRVRPQNAQEKLEKCGRSALVIECNKDREIIVKERANSTLTKTFTFDRVFASDSKQIDVYKNVVNPLIDEVLAGYNCTVFAYGQTGTGKTYTMEGEKSSEDLTWEKDPQSGIIPRVLNHIFDELRMQQLEFTMSVSYLELYNEELIDLLSPIDDSTKLRLFEDAAQKGSLVIQGLQEILVLDKKEVYEIMSKGAQKRQTAATLMNAHSSRSHTIFTVTVHIRESTDDGEELLRTGKINLVDLAGSENIGRSGAKQQRAREAGNINQSLLTLGRVITALVERTPHVPYRESKLTRLLQDSLGGRTKTSIIATVSPVLANLEETLSTLDYAHRAKSITNRPEINQRLTKKALLKEYTTEIERLRRDLEATRDGTGVFMAQENYLHMTQRLEKQDSEIAENIQRIRALEEEREKKEAICDRLHMELEEKSQQLVSTIESLEVTRSTLMDTREELQRTEDDRDEKKVLLESHVSTEQILSTQASTLLTVADQSTTDLQRVHDKLDRKRSLEEQNFEAVQEFQKAFGQKLARMRDNIATYTEDHREQIGEVRTKLDETLKSTRQIDAKAHEEASSFIESHGNSLQALETELRQQAEDRQRWSHAQLQSARDAAESQTAAMHAALTQAYKRIDALTQEVDNLKSSTAQTVKDALLKVDAQEQVVRQFLQNQVDFITGMHHLVATFSQKINAELQSSKDQIAGLIEQRETTHKLEISNLAQIIELVQNTNSMLISRRDEEQQYLQKMSDIGQEQHKIIIDHAVSVGSQLSDLDARDNALQREHEEFSTHISTGIRDYKESLMNGLDSVAGGQKAMVTDVQAMEKMVEQGWQQHASDVENEMRAYAELARADLDSLGIHAQDLKEKTLREAEAQSAFTEARQKTLTELMQAAHLQLSEQTSATHAWSSHHNHELFERSQEVTEFLNQGLKQDQPTGNTPQRRVMEFPRELKVTSPHERILQRFRAAQMQRRLPLKCSSVDSVLMSSGDENSVYHSTSASSLSIPSSPEEGIEENKENGSKDLIVNTDSTKLDLLKSSSKNVQDISNKTARKALAHQN